MSAPSSVSTPTKETTMMRYDAGVSAHSLLRSLCLPVVSSHRQALTWGSVDAPTTIMAIAGQGETSGATPLLLHHYRRAHG
jgi:hypothetical protein